MTIYRYIPATKGVISCPNVQHVISEFVEFTHIWNIEFNSGVKTLTGLLYLFSQLNHCTMEFLFDALGDVEADILDACDPPLSRIEWCKELDIFPLIEVVRFDPIFPKGRQSIQLTLPRHPRSGMLSYGNA